MKSIIQFLRSVKTKLTASAPRSPPRSTKAAVACAAADSISREPSPSASQTRTAGRRFLNLVPTMKSSAFDCLPSSSCAINRVCVAAWNASVDWHWQSADFSISKGIPMVRKKFERLSELHLRESKIPLTRSGKRFKAFATHSIEWSNPKARPPVRWKSFDKHSPYEQPT